MTAGAIPVSGENMADPAPVALVTGACGGIGAVTTRVFAARGYRLALTDIDGDRLERATAELRAGGTEAYGHACDVGDADSVAGLFAWLERRYGRLDAAFNNAGVGGGGTPLAETDDARWDACLRVNLNGTYQCMKHEVRMMLAQGHGAIVNNCSVLGINGGANAAYTASKHGIAGLTKSAAISYGARGLRVNAVCPGLIAAGLGLNILQRQADRGAEMIALHPAGRAGRAEEVAEAVAWLCSEQASFVNGHLLAVDGGYGCR